MVLPFGQNIKILSQQVNLVNKLLQYTYTDLPWFPVRYTEKTILERNVSLNHQFVQSFYRIHKKRALAMDCICLTHPKCLTNYSKR